MISKLFKLEKFKQRVANFMREPLFWAIYLTLLWVVTKLRSMVYGYLLKTHGLSVGPGCSVRGLRSISMGHRVSIHSGLWLEAVYSYRGQLFSPKISIGAGVSFSRDVHITGIEFISIGKNVLFGSRVFISDHNHGSYSGENQSLSCEPPADRRLSPGGPVIIGDNVWIGDNVIIIGPVNIGAGSILAANSVIKDDVQVGTIVAGIPARPIKLFDPEFKIWRRL